MRRLTLPALLLAVVLIVAAASSAAPRGPVAQAQAVPTATSSPNRDCVFLPLVRAGDPPAAAAAPAQPASPDCLAPPAAPPAPSPEPPAPLTRVAGELQLRPEHAVVETTRRPTRWTIVLDVSGSMSANFAGQCDRSTSGQAPPAGQGYWQCANGPDGAPPIQVGGTGPIYWWGNQAERRITVAKNALEEFVAQINLPGNPEYDPSHPSDQVGLVWFSDRALRTGSAADYSSDRAALVQSIRDAGAYQGDPYRTIGGSNIAAGLYRAALLLDTAPRTVLHEGRSYDYRSQVVLVTDSVANFFLDRSAPTLSGGYSDEDTYPLGHPCRIPQAPNIAACQTTAVGGLTPSGVAVAAGMDRPITQSILVSQQDLQARGSDVWAVAISYLPGTGLQDGVASAPSNYAAAETLQVLADGSTNVDTIMREVVVRSGSRLETQCTPTIGDWTGTIPPERAPGGFAFPQVGVVQLQNVDTGAGLSAPVLSDPIRGALTYRFEGVPSGDYTLTATVGYNGLDSQTRSYSQIELGGEQFTELFVPITGADQQLDTLSLRLNGDVCQQ